MNDSESQMDESQMEDVPAVRLLASCTLKLPNRKLGKAIKPGEVVKAGKEIPADAPQQWVEDCLDQGLIYAVGAPPLRREVKMARREEDLNVSSVKRGEQEDNPLDDGIALVAGDGDPALASRLEEIAAEQAEEGIEDDGEPEDHKVEVNLGTGEITETGKEPDLEDLDDDDVADSQVS